MSPSPSAIYPGALTPDAIQKLVAAPFALLPASGAIDPHTSNRYMITKAGVAALTLAAPAAGADDGLCIELTSSTAFAHTVTATGLYQDGAAHVNVATFPAQIGGSIALVAWQGKWIVQSLQAVVMS
jgi:hypothetical protein